MKIDKMLETARKMKKTPGQEYDYSKLSTEELKELIYGIENNSITDERINELLEKVKIK